MHLKSNMKILKTLFVAIGIIFILISVVSISPYNYLIKGVRLVYLKGEKTANYMDWVDFDLRKISTGDQKKNTIVATEKFELNQALTAMLDKTNSGAYLVYRNDTLISENYFRGITDSTKTNSFSMAKTITTLLVQHAIQDKIIGSWDDKVIQYLPWITGKYANEVTLRHLTTMTAGLDWDESYVSPFGITAQAYYSNDIEGVMRTVTFANKPGDKFIYQSGSTQFLGFVLMHALDEHRKLNEGKSVKTYSTISEYAQENLWKKIGAEYPAAWSLDKKNGKEITYCCFNSTARDFGKLGSLVMHNGKNQLGEQVIDSAFLNIAQKPFKSENYGHSFWLGKVGDIDISYFQGHNGQYIIMPKDNSNMVVVRTGHGKDKSNNEPVFNCVKSYIWYAKHPKGESLPAAK